MIALLGIKKNTTLDIRSRFSIGPSKHNVFLEELKKEFKEVLILGTCNRTEIYINTFEKIDDEDIIKRIFNVLDWNYDELRQWVFLSKNEIAISHLMEVVCGFHSRILGEDQILGQIKNSYQLALDCSSLGYELQRLFEEALGCGKKFRTECRIFEVPVSSVSIAVNNAMDNGAKKFMVISYGEMGKLAVKYLLSHTQRVEELYIVVRNKEVVSDLNDNRVKVLDFNEKDEVINTVDAIISCSAATHTLITKEHISQHGNKMLIFDLAVPRDVDSELESYSRVKLYDIDVISSIDDENRALRKDRMVHFRYIIDDKIREFIKWQTSRQLVPVIKALKVQGETTALERVNVFSNKSKSRLDLDLAETLIKSTSNTYVNKAISVLKEESLNGCGEEALRIISKIFLEE